MNPSTLEAQADRSRGTLAAGDQAAVVILNWNGWQDTRACLSAIEKTFKSGTMVLIVDNGSTDGSVDHLLAEMGRGREGLPRDLGKWNSAWADAHGRVFRISGPGERILLALERNGGGSGGRNAGIDWLLSNTDVSSLFFLDNDAWAENDVLTRARSLSRRWKADVVGCLILNPDRSPQFAGLDCLTHYLYAEPILRLFRAFPFPPARSPLWPVDAVSTAGLFMTRAILEKLIKNDGFAFNPHFFHWSEDHEISLRAIRAGARVIMARECAVFHRISRGGAGKAAAYYYSARNRMFIANRFLPVLAWVCFHAFYPFYRGFRAFFFMLSGDAATGRALLEGLIDGYRGKGGPWRKQALSNQGSGCLGREERRQVSPRE